MSEREKNIRAYEKREVIIIFCKTSIQTKYYYQNQYLKESFVWQK